MSAKATTWAKAFRAGNATGKGILLVLADYADDRGCCWASIATICHESEVKKRAVQYWLEKWEKEGVIRRVARTRSNSNARTTNYIVLCGHRAELIANAIKKGTSLPDRIEGYEDPRAPDAPPEDASADDAPVQEMHGGGAQDAPGGCMGVHPLKKNPIGTYESSSPPTPSLGEGEGYGLFKSVFPMDRSTNVSDARGRNAWRTAVDTLGPEAVLASARNYAGKISQTGQIPVGILRFLDLRPGRGLVRQFVPAEVRQLEPVDLGDSDEHRFLAECREAGAKEEAIRRYAQPGAMRFVRDGAVTAVVVADRIDEFNAEFSKVTKAHGLSVWTETYAQRRLEKKGKVA